MAPNNLKILMVMDSGFNADLIGRLLRKGGMNVEATRVYDEETMRAALADAVNLPDVILCEDVLRRFDCLSAMSVGQQLCPGVPIIFLSGGQGEELAIESIKGGAQDFVLMSNLARLPRAIERAVKEAGEHALSERLVRERAASDRYFSKLVEQAGECVISTDLDGMVRSWNHAAESLYGFTMSEAVGKSLHALSLAHLGDEEYAGVIARIRSGKPYAIESRRRRKTGKMLLVHSNHAPLFDDGGSLIGQVGISRDISGQEQKAGRLSRLSGVSGFGSEADASAVEGTANSKVVIVLGTSGRDSLRNDRPG